MSNDGHKEGLIGHAGLDSTTAENEFVKHRF